VPNNLANELARLIRIVVVHRVQRLAEIAPALDTFKHINTFAWSTGRSPSPMSLGNYRPSVTKTAQPCAKPTDMA
jgi:hypothetical protein